MMFDDPEFKEELNRRLNFLEAYMDTLRRAKQAARDTDFSVVEEATHIQKKAREYYNRGELAKAWAGVHWAEGCMIIGHAELREHQRLSAEIEKLLSLNHE